MVGASSAWPCAGSVATSPPSPPPLPFFFRAGGGRWWQRGTAGGFLAHARVAAGVPLQCRARGRERRRIDGAAAGARRAGPRGGPAPAHRRVWRRRRRGRRRAPPPAPPLRGRAPGPPPEQGAARRSRRRARSSGARCVSCQGQAQPACPACWCGLRSGAPQALRVDRLTGRAAPCRHRH